MNSPLPATLCARQPIFDAQLNIIAYELLFRDSDSECADIHDQDSASSQVILNVFTEHPLGHLLEEKKGFINFTRELLRLPPPVTEKKIVIEILENIEVNPEMIRDVKRLKNEGYTIALDDYVFNAHHHKLLELADIIKIDVLSQSYANVSRELKALEKYNVTFLAEKIETQKDFIQCKQLGFTLFQGYFLSKPNNVKGKKIDGDQAALVRFLKILQDSSAEFDEINIVISASPVFTYKLLRLINSAAFTFDEPINSIHKALTLLGLEKIRAWGSLLTMTEMSSKPKSLTKDALIRAKMCKSLAEASSLTDLHEDSLFMAGLLSSIDAFLDLPMEEIITLLGLPAWLEDTLIERKGSMGLILNTAIFFERAEFDNVDWNKLRHIGLQAEDVQSGYQDSICWAAALIDQLI